MAILSINFQIPLVEIIGQNGCHFFSISINLHRLELSIGGLSLGIFRVICVFNNHISINMKSAWRLMKVIMTVQCIATIICLIFVVVGVSYSGNYFDSYQDKKVLS